MEFYLGNSNLVRDKRLLSKLWTISKVKPKHCLAMADFLEFNKMKAIFDNFELPATPPPLQPERPRIVFLDEEEAKSAKNPDYNKIEPTDDDVVLRG